MNVYLKLFFFVLAWIVAPAPAIGAGVSLVEGFELSEGGFTTASLNSWKWGTPAFAGGPVSAHSGAKVWGTNLSGSYAADLDAVLLSPVYDLSAAAGQHIVLHWWQHLITEEGFDFAEVQVSNNSGGSWTTVYGPRHGAVNAQWTQHTILLDPTYATAGFQIRFRLTSDSSNSVGGFYVDDIRLTSASFSPAAALQDFETDDGGYVDAGANSSWAYGTPMSAPGSASSGQFAWATNLDGFYNAEEDSTLTSPTLDLSGSVGKLLAVTWKQFLDTEEGYDFLNVEASGDGGATWTPLTTQSGAVGTGGWMSRQAFVPSSFATSTFRLRYRFQSDEAYQYDGVAIDDIAIISTQDLFPVAGSFAKSASQNYPIPFTQANFESAYSDPDGGELTSIIIDQLPSSGALTLNAAPVAVNDVIPVESLHALLFTPPADTPGAWTFLYHAANFFGPSAAATVTLNILGPTPQIEIVEQPQVQTVNPQASATFEVVAVSSLTLQYQWRKDGADIEGATAATYTIASVSEGDEDSYDVVVSNDQDSAVSSSALLSVNDPVVFINQPGASSVNEGGDITFTVSASGTGRLDYQWYKDGVLLVDETFPSLLIEDAQEADTGSYHCIVSNIVGPRSSDPFQFTVLLAPRIVANPISVGIEKFRPATFEVVVEGAGPFTYQWLKDGFEIPGATASILVIDDLRNVSMGDYTVRVSNGWATTESEPAELQVVNWPDVRGNYQDVLERPDAPAGESTCPGRLTVTPTGVGSVSGRLTYDGSTHAFAGRLDSQLVLERVIRRGKRSPLTVRIKLDAVALTVAATVSHQETSGLVTSTALLPKHRYAVRVNPAPQQGRYTVLLTPEAGAVGAPQAPAYLTGVVSAAGVATWRGKLPNGVALTGSGFVHTTGRQPLHLLLGGASGEVCGRLGFNLEGETPLVDGGLVWRHRPKANAPFMPAAFVALLEAEGSLYTPPTLLQPVLTLPQGAEMFALAIEGPFTAGLLERWLRLEPRHLFLIDPATDAKIKLKLNRALGIVTGSFIDVDTRRRHTLEGVALQGQVIMGGFFRGVTEPGSFLVEPLLQ